MSRCACGVPSQVAPCAVCRYRKRHGIQPVRSRAVQGIQGLSWNEIRTLAIVDFIGQYARRAANHYVQRKPASARTDTCELPSAKECVDEAAAIPRQLGAATDRQLPDGARREIRTHIELTRSLFRPDGVLIFRHRSL